MASSGQEVVDLFAGHFASVYSPASVIDLVLDTSIPSLITSLNIDICDVRRAILQTSDSANSGHDGLPNYFLRRCVDSLDRRILDLFNHSLNQGSFPKYWKTSYIKPIF